MTGLLALGCMTVMAQPARASTTVSGTGTIKVSIPNSCTLSVSGQWTLPGTYPSGGQIAKTDSSADSAIGVVCTGNSSPQLSIPLNGNANGGVRRMTDGNSHYISYALIDNASNSPLGGAGQTVNLTYDVRDGQAYYNGGTIDFGVRVAAQAAPPPGAYSDTLTLSVSY